jgi:hypothetical protein
MMDLNFRRKCPFDDCNLYIPPSFFACSDHWRLLTAEQQDQVWWLYADWKHGEIDSAELLTRQRKILAEVQAPK